MQKLNGYIETQYLSVLYSPDTTTVNRSRTVYARPIKLYRGITNTVQLRLLDNDQKSVNVSNKTFVLNIVDPTTYLVIKNKTVTLGNTTQSQAGKVDFALTSTDMSTTNAGRFIYSIYELNSDSSKTIIYSDDDYDADGQIQIFDAPYVGFSASTEVTFSTMTASTTTDNSSYALAHAHLDTDSLHTAQYYLVGYTGTITIQITVDADPSSLLDSDWVDLSNTTYTAETGSVSVNFTGNYTAVRFKSVKTAGTITKVLYRP
jgi:hypothetical protein